MAQTTDGGKDFKPLAVAKASNVPVLGRTRWMGHLQKAATPVATGTAFQKMSAFIDRRTWSWVRDYVKGMFGGKFGPYPAYALDGKAGVYRMRAHDGGGPVRISMVGDWGTGTEEASKVAESMMRFRPDYTVHLGDVYFVGDEQDVRENFLGVAGGQFKAVAFPKGRVGTLTMIGNHEMYGGGRPYFTHMLPYCETGEGPQRASFWCLESEHWRLIAIDTGYNSVGKPVLGSMPHVDKIPWVGADCALQQELLDWLRVNVRPREQPKATVLLSHHQYFSAFRDETFQRPAKQLREFFHGQDLVWIWGHEHRVTVYEKHSPADGHLTCHARCLGHGGMPVECGKPDLKRAPAAFYDARCDYPVGDGSCAGWNGFLNVTMEGQEMLLEYRDLNDALMFQERMTAEPGGGVRVTVEDEGVLVRAAR